MLTESILLGRESKVTPYNHKLRVAHDKPKLKVEDLHSILKFEKRSITANTTFLVYFFILMTGLL